jgi:hypothetical protein
MALSAFGVRHLLCSHHFNRPNRCHSQCLRPALQRLRCRHRHPPASRGRRHSPATVFSPGPCHHLPPAGSPAILSADRCPTPIVCATVANAAAFTVALFAVALLTAAVASVASVTAAAAIDRRRRRRCRRRRRRRRRRPGEQTAPRRVLRAKRCLSVAAPAGWGGCRRGPTAAGGSSANEPPLRAPR